MDNDKINKRIEEYFNNITPEELMDKLVNKYGFKFAKHIPISNGGYVLFKLSDSEDGDTYNPVMLNDNQLIKLNDFIESLSNDGEINVDTEVDYAEYIENC